MKPSECPKCHRIVWSTGIFELEEQEDDDDDLKSQEPPELDDNVDGPQTVQNSDDTTSVFGNLYETFPPDVLPDFICDSPKFENSNTRFELSSENAINQWRLTAWLSHLNKLFCDKLLVKKGTILDASVLKKGSNHTNFVLKSGTMCDTSVILRKNESRKFIRLWSRFVEIGTYIFRLFFMFLFSRSNSNDADILSINSCNVELTNGQTCCTDFHETIESNEPILISVSSRNVEISNRQRCFYNFYQVIDRSIGICTDCSVYVYVCIRYVLMMAIFVLLFWAQTFFVDF